MEVVRMLFQGRRIFFECRSILSQPSTGPHLIFGALEFERFREFSADDDEASSGFVQARLRKIERPRLRKHANRTVYPLKIADARRMAYVIQNVLQSG